MNGCFATPEQMLSLLRTAPRSLLIRWMAAPDKCRALAAPSAVVANTREDRFESNILGLKGVDRNLSENETWIGCTHSRPDAIHSLDGRQKDLPRAF